MTPRHWAHCHGAIVGDGPVPVVIGLSDPVVTGLGSVVCSVVGPAVVASQFKGQIVFSLQLSPSNATLHPQKKASSYKKELNKTILNQNV